MAHPYRLTPPLRETLDPSWLKTTFSDLWERNAESLRDREAIVDAKKRLTWQEGNEWIDQFAYGLVQLGLKKDDCVVIQLPNCVELALLRIACERAGLICMPISRALKGKEVEYILTKVKAKVYISRWKFRDVNYLDMVEAIRGSLPLEHVIIAGEAVPPGAIALDSFLTQKHDASPYQEALRNRKCTPAEFSLVAHTSGSTGFPKFVENPIYSRMELAKAQVERLKMTGDDVTGILSPNSGGPNTFGYLASPLVGAKVVMIENFEPEQTMQRIEKEKITLLLAVPTMVIAMVDHPKFRDYDLSSLRVIVAAGAAFHHHEAIKAEKALGCVIVPNYGSVDCGLTVMGNPADSQEIRLTTVGKPLGRCEVKLLKEDGEIASPGEEGEIFVRGRDNITSYFMDSESNRLAWDEEGWFRMGDIGRLDLDGNLTILGRKKDVIIRGGQNIIPGEVERFLSLHEKVAEAAVVGMYDRLMGERVCAYVVPKNGAEISMDELNSFLKENRVAYYKLLERLEIVVGLPVVGDKVNKKKLVEDINRKLESEGAFPSKRSISSPG